MVLCIYLINIITTKYFVLLFIIGEYLFYFYNRKHIFTSTFFVYICASVFLEVL